jgi:hypothetical protein
LFHRFKIDSFFDLSISRKYFVYVCIQLLTRHNVDRKRIFRNRSPLLFIMIDFQRLFPYLRIILFGIIVLVAIIYSIPIMCLRRFHYRNNFLTLNICIATTLCSLYWFLFYLMLELNAIGTFMFLLDSCQFVSLFPVLLTLQVPFSFLTVSINRLFAVVYHNRVLFKRKSWTIICLAAQWILGAILTIPILTGIGQVCSLFFFSIYADISFHEIRWI